MKPLILNPAALIIAILFVVFAGVYIVGLLTAKNERLFDRQYNNLRSWIICADITRSNYEIIKRMFEEIADNYESVESGNRERLEVLEVFFYKKYKKHVGYVKPLTEIELN